MIFLWPKEKELQLHQAGNRFYTEMGKILTEANATLSQNGYGCFIQWSESIGIKKHTSYNLINRYLLAGNNSIDVIFIYNLLIMMLGSKAFDPSDTGLLRTACSRNPQNIRNSLIFL